MMAHIIYENENSKTLLAAQNLDDLDAIYREGKSARLRHAGRAVWKKIVRDSDVDEKTLYVKMHWGKHRLVPRFSELRQRQAYRSMPQREWQGNELFRKIGLNVAERCAVLNDGLWNFRSAMIMKAVPPEKCIDEMLQDGSWNEIDEERRELLLDTMIATLEKIHAANLNWKGATSRHFFPEWDENQGWELWLIDCEGARRGCNDRMQERDFRKFYRSMEESGADEKTLKMLREKIDKLERS